MRRIRRAQARPAPRRVVVARPGVWAAVTAAGLSVALLSAQQTSQQPIFRGGANLVQVDAYPTRDGRVVEGLTAADFQVFEDGKPQQVDSLEFIRVEPNTPDAFRRDPNTQEEGNQLAADPHNRVFVVYLDHYHMNLVGSHSTRRPLVDFLNRLLAPNDLFGVMTPLLRPRDLILGRQTLTLEEQLARYWFWGDKGMVFEPEEQAFAMNCAPMAVPFARRRMDTVLSSLEGLMGYLGNLREARKVVVILTRGWVLEGRNEAAANASLGRGSGIPAIGVDPRGRITTNPDPMRGSSGDRGGCANEIYRLYMEDFQQRMRELVDAANRNNVTFYPLNPAGLEAPDVMNAPSVESAMSVLRGREDSVRTLAGATDGFAIMTNDLNAGFRRIADDVSAYYVLGYYSTNLKFDGRFRRIEVKMKPPGLRVRARRGYFSPTEGSAPSRPGVATPAPPKVPSPVDVALGVLSRLRPSAELFAHGAASATELAVAVEIASLQTSGGRWAQGADVQVGVTDAAGAVVATEKGRIEPGTRGGLVRIPLPAGSSGPWRVSARVTSGEGTLQDGIDVARSPGTLVGDHLVFRATPAGQSPLRAVADMQFRRTERVHLEWPALAALDRREARLLGRNGSPLAVPVTVTERDVNGQKVIAADLNLAPLTEADYVIELVAGAGTEAERKFVGIRVVR